jgi:hypothetical protein
MKTDTSDAKPVVSNTLSYVRLFVCQQVHRIAYNVVLTACLVLTRNPKRKPELVWVMTNVTFEFLKDEPNVRRSDGIHIVWDI